MTIIDNIKILVKRIEENRAFDKDAVVEDLANLLKGKEVVDIKYALDAVYAAGFDNGYDCGANNLC